ncbi:uncharacterized protein EI90DRAFT_2970765 [Cantharellus anzutake]|uniref:uncharacterized protein n=1 Tax=Cantharellus anzutake TaxID=1750568 RepID=UPI0019051B56|nr:uncharacterized protein EI90DRAFT_2970765 [Cantharellus anzutake]KAF8334314.1 hypothetical protein EI90DRAFT_2970765 [Cantharellus anzutake]
MSTKLSFALGKPKPKGGAAPAPLTRKAPVFGSFEDDDVTDAAPTALDSRPAMLDVNRHLAARSVSASATNGSPNRAVKKKMEKEISIDPTVYEYDEVYDQMKEAQAKSKAAKVSEDSERKPKYIGSLLASAETRRLDRIRAEEVMIQREREQEGDMYADKERYVTQAYKEQMEMVRQAEKEEKEREEQERTKRGAGGMTHFYAQLLQQSEEEHAASVAATTVKGPTFPDVPANLTITKPLKPAAKSDALLAQLARDEGKEVELNDDSQIVDRRELLSAGLNLSGVNTRRLGGLLSSRTKKATDEPINTHTAVGSAATKREIRERQQRLIESQLEEEKERVAQAKKEREQEARERVVKRKNDDEAVISARERYLERKRRKLEELQASGEAASDSQETGLG